MRCSSYKGRQAGKGSAVGVLDGVHKVLAEAGQPMHYRAITEKLVADGHWKPSGKTPWASVSSALTTDIKKHGASSRFRRLETGVFALADWALTTGRDAARPPSPRAHVSFADAAEKVLSQFANRRPMHYKVITQKALDLAWIHPSGLTPWATMNAQILTEIQRQQNRGDVPRFQKCGRGLYGLTIWQGEGLVKAITQHNSEVREKLLGRLHSMSPADFEALIKELLMRMGFESVEMTSRAGDGGIDVRGVKVVDGIVPIRMAVQVKRWKRNVQSPVVQEVRGSLRADEHGLIITTSDFSEGAKQEAIRSGAIPIALVSGKELVALLVEHDIQIRRITHDLIELGENEEGE